MFLLVNMTKPQILFLLAALACASTHISVEDLHITLLEKINIASQQVDKTKQIVSAATTASGVVPYLNEMVSLITAADILFSEAEDEIKKIEDISKRAVAEQAVRLIEASMRTISDNVAQLKNDDIENSSKFTLVHLVHNDLNHIINQYDAYNSIFREYSLIAVRPLMLIASMVAVYRPIMEYYVPDLARNSFLPCKLYDTLNEYRSIAVFQRLNKLGMKATMGFVLAAAGDRHLEENFYLIDVLLEQSIRNVERVDCNIYDSANERAKLYWYLHDEYDDKGYSCSITLSDQATTIRNSGPADLLRVYRRGIENIFDKTLDLVRDLPCKRPQQTGYF